MRVCIERKTGILLESQSGGTEAHLEALTRNAAAAGYAKSDVDIRLVSDEEFTQIMAAQPKGEPVKSLAQQIIDDPEQLSILRKALTQ